MFKSYTSTLKILIILQIFNLSYSPVAKAQKVDWYHEIKGISLDYGVSTATDSTGNFYVAGVFSGTVDLDPSSNVFQLSQQSGREVLVAKYSSKGILLWGFKLRGFGTEDIDEIVIDHDGNLVIVGEFNGNTDFDPSAADFFLSPNGGTDIFMAKYKPDGTFIWAKAIGSQNSEFTDGLATDESNNVYVVGSFRGTLDFDPSNNTAFLTAKGSADFFVAKYDKNGLYKWAFNVGYPGGQQTTGVRDIAVDRNGDIIITGSISYSVDFDPSSDTAILSGNSGSIVKFLAKYDSSGNYQWGFSLGNQSSSIGTALTVDGMNNIYTTGTYSNTIDFDPSSSVFNLKANPKGGGAYLAKYNAIGEFKWAYGFGGQIGFGGINAGEDIEVDKLGNVYITGRFSGTVDFDPSFDSLIFNANINPNSFIASYNPMGGLITADVFRSNGSMNGHDITINNSLQLFATGYYSDTVFLGSETPVFTPFQSGFSLRDMYIAQFSFNDRTSKCVSVLSDGSWLKSTVVNSTNLQGLWTGASSLPTVGSYLQSVELGQPYGFNSIDIIEASNVISAGSDITYYRKVFEIGDSTRKELRLLLTVDDQADIYLNGHRIALITDFGRPNFKFPAHDLKFFENGTVENGYLGGDSFNYVTNASMDTLLKSGTNELIVAVRNLGKSSDKGGFSFQMDIGCQDSIVAKKGDSFSPEQNDHIEIYPNPTTDVVILSTVLAIEEVRISDLSGKCLSRSSNEATKDISLDLSAYPSGVYLIEIQEVGGEVIQRKVIRQ